MERIGVIVFKMVHVRQAIMLVIGLSVPLIGQTTMLDNTFGTNGTVTAFIAGGDSDYDEGQSVALQSDGKIVVAGWSTDSQARYEFAVARFDVDGALDNTFGTNGTARVPIAGGNMDNDKAYSVAIQADGKIVLAGFSPDTTGGTEYVAFALARFNPNGTLDNTFGTNGTVRAFIGSGVDSSGFPIYAAGYSVAIQPNGKIVVAGNYVDIFSGYGFAVARFNPNGSLDNTFGTNGTVTFSISGESYTLDYGRSVAIQTDGKIVTAGYSLSSNGNNSFALARLDSNGSLDNTFGSAGKAGTFISGGGNDDEGYSVAIQSDGKIVVAGFSSDTTSALGNTAFAVARFNPNGTTDSTFGTNGTVRAYINGGDSISDRAYSVAIQTDGKIVVGGSTSSSLVQSSFAIARFNSNGTMDSTFGTNGTTTTTFGTDVNIDDAARGLDVQSDGKTVAAGYSQASFGATAFVVARYLPSNVTGITEAKSLPKSFELDQNYPNPFNPNTIIIYQLPMISQVTLKVYDVLGREVQTLVNTDQTVGRYSVTFDGSRFASGIYFYRVNITSNDGKNFVSTKKMLLMK